MLITKSGILFELLITCFINDMYVKNNINLHFILTQLTAYHYHYKY